ncbi:MAG: hypothetical protein KBC00_02630 [Candidatus Levybacteria bacterium]|nr:hypothetical protein [Candidatus Levybacteria bacterium]MBP9815025.1 hypothetical protein [Candidatus Levybacteria bacterium]
MIEHESQPKITMKLFREEYMRLHAVSAAYGGTTLSSAFAEGVRFLEFLDDYPEVRQAFLRITEKTHLGNPFERYKAELDDEDGDSQSFKISRPVFQLPLHPDAEATATTLAMKHAFDIETPEEFLELSLDCLETLLVAKRTNVSTTAKINGKKIDLYDLVEARIKGK